MLLQFHPVLLLDGDSGTDPLQRFFLETLRNPEGDRDPIRGELHLERFDLRLAAIRGPGGQRGDAQQEQAGGAPAHPSAAAP